MSEINFQNLLSYSIPKDMRTMTNEEMITFFPNKNEKYSGIRNEEKHTIISVGCKKRPFFVGRNSTLEANLMVTEKKISKPISSYKNIGYGKRTIDGKEILTFKFNYSIRGNNQTGEYGLYMNSKYFISFECIYREDCKEFAEMKFDEFISSVKLCNY